MVKGGYFVPNNEGEGVRKRMRRFKRDGNDSPRSAIAELVLK